ncbi:MAG: glutathione S-transferase family protein [Pseudomonadota bacterium]
MSQFTLWGFAASTYVRTVRMVLAEKGVSDYCLNEVSAITGQTRQAEHLARHPFGRIPVLEHDGERIYETAAICQYLDTILPGRAVMPSEPKARAKADMAMGIVVAYAHPSFLLKAVAYHLFADAIGGKDEAMRAEGMAVGRIVVSELMRMKGVAPFIAGAEHSLADYAFAPIFAYAAMTPEKDELLAIGDMADWWARVCALDSFQATAPH